MTAESIYLYLFLVGIFFTVGNIVISGLSHVFGGLGGHSDTDGSGSIDSADSSGAIHSDSVGGMDVHDSGGIDMQGAGAIDMQGASAFDMQGASAIDTGAHFELGDAAGADGIGMDSGMDFGDHGGADFGGHGSMDFDGHDGMDFGDHGGTDFGGHADAGADAGAGFGSDTDVDFDSDISPGFDAGLHMDLGGHHGAGTGMHHGAGTGGHHGSVSSGHSSNHSDAHAGSHEVHAARSGISAAGIVSLMMTWLPLRPTAMICFSAVTGGVGSIFCRLDMANPLTHTISIASGYGLSMLLGVALPRRLRRAQNTSAAERYELIGLSAVVTSSIIEGGFGRISYTVRDNTYSAPARHIEGKRMPQGALAVICEIKKNVFYVTELSL